MSGTKSDPTHGLSPKDVKTWQQINASMDKHEYPKVVRLCDQILSSVPEHGETLALKGLALHYSGKKDGEDGGYALIKKGIQKAMRSPLCWHSLACAHRADRQYIESLKAFKFTMRLDSDSVNNARDAAAMAIQARDWDYFIEMREKLLNSKSNVRLNWLGLSAGHRMKRQYDLAAAIVDVMAMILDAGDSPAEISEVQLYRCELEILAGRPEKALAIIEENRKALIDAVGTLVVEAKALAAIGGAKVKDAEEAHWKLIGFGYAESDSLLAIAKLRGIKLNETTNAPLDDAARTQFVQLLNEAHKKYPKCDPAKRMLLDVVPIAEFEKLLSAYATPFVTKNIPSLVSVLKSLYKDAARVEIIGAVFKRWEDQLKASDFSSFGGASDPTYLLWVYTFLSSHFRRTGNFAEAHRYIDLAIAHTPSVEMLYLLRAKIFHREGKANEAAEAADVAQRLDLQDKYLNGTAAKYMFRAGRIEDAERLMGLFYKKSPVEDQFLTARDSQCAWYERECGEAELKRGDPVAALQNFLLYETHQSDNRFCLMEFHNYTFRRGNVRAWLDVIESDDNAEQRRAFVRLCPSIVRAYLAVAAMGEEAALKAHKPRPVFGPTGDADEDKLREERAKEFTPKVDLADPLGKANTYMASLLRTRPGDAATHTLAVELYTAWDKPVLVCRSLNALLKYNFAAEAKRLGADFKAKVVAAKKGSWPPAVAAIVDETLAKISA